MDSIEEYPGGLRIKVYVKPMSHITRFVYEDEELIFYTKEKPLKGKANNSLIKYLSKKLRISSSKIKIVAGVRERLKTIVIEGVNRQEFIEAITD